MTQQFPKVELLTTRSKLEAGREQTVDVLIRITPPDPEALNNSRPALNLSLVLDRSGLDGGRKNGQSPKRGNVLRRPNAPTHSLKRCCFRRRHHCCFPVNLLSTIRQ